MKMFVLASGSKGNSTYIETENQKILIDAGISKKRIDEALKNVGVSCSDIDSIFITHEHSDHIYGLAMLLKKTNANLYLSSGTFNALKKLKNPALNEACKMAEENGRVFLFNHASVNMFYEQINLKDVVVEPITIFHDALEPTGYVITNDSKKVVYITDTGYIHQALFQTIANANCYVLETNHDPDILMNSDRDFSLKMRILSDHGHLSNEDAFVNLCHVLGINTKYVFYAHISEECNLQIVVDATRRQVFEALGVDDSDIDFIFTSQTPTKEIEL